MLVALLTAVTLRFGGAVLGGPTLLTPPPPNQFLTQTTDNVTEQAAIDVAVKDSRARCGTTSSIPLSLHPGKRLFVPQRVDTRAELCVLLQTLRQVGNRSV